MDESEVQQRIQIEGPVHGCILMRNNVGAFTNSTGRNVRFGLGNVSKKHNDNMTSSDLIGVTVITITPEMVGKKVGVITAIECKESKWKFHNSPRERAQNNFIEFIKAHHGIAGFANSVESFVSLVKSFLK